ncbi:MAG: TPM domain-containing protein [Alphaproteobacteria bacterium]|nr:TPM domain-containing protein [Alphaproteobacteria bacterium]
MALFSSTDEHQIAKAIADAESKTAGEIVAVVARESNTYLYAPFLWAAIIALFVPWPFIVFTWWPVIWIYGVQLVVFLLLLSLFLVRPLRYALVPKSVKDRTAHRRAREQFLAQTLHTTKKRTGVLIFVSVAERYAEIIADTEIDAKVPDSEWQSIVHALTEAIGRGHPTQAFVDTIKRVGTHLAKSFPPGTADPNELPDHLIVLDDLADDL